MHCEPEHVVPLAFGSIGQAAHAPWQARKFVLQLNPHEKPSQVGVPFGSVGHALHDAPQVAVAAFDTQTPLQRWKPEAQAEVTHVAPEQLVPMAFASLGHAAHPPWHSRNPAWHWKPQLVPLQTAMPLGSPGHAEQLDPHDDTDVFDTH